MGDDGIKIAFQRACNDAYFSERDGKLELMILYRRVANSLQDAYPELIEALMKENGIDP